MSGPIPDRLDPTLPENRLPRAAHAQRSESHGWVDGTVGGLPAAPLPETPGVKPELSKTHTGMKSWSSLVHADFLNDKDESGKSAGKDTASPACTPRDKKAGAGDRVRRRAVRVGAAGESDGPLSLHSHGSSSEVNTPGFVSLA